MKCCFRFLGLNIEIRRRKEKKIRINKEKKFEPEKDYAKITEIQNTLWCQEVRYKK